MSRLPCFKAYDIRGKVPDELNEELAFYIGQAYAARFKPAKMAVAHDIRLSGPALTKALTKGFLQAGVDVVNIGECGTEEIYHAAFSMEDVDGGIIVTASHNPAEYNGMKMVRKGAIPVSGDTGLFDIEKMARHQKTLTADQSGVATTFNNRPAYINHLLTYINRANLKPLKLVVNPGNGNAGPIIDLLEQHLPFEFIRLQETPDGTFPNSVPNPLLPENRAITSQAVQEHQAKMGIAWDGDFDRCFLFDENGNFIEGYYIVGLLAGTMLAKHPGAKIIHDPRLTWNTREIVTALGGTPILTKTGHAFIKERMRKEDAVYGGEMSAHHYFRNFSYCDSGMIPWLLVSEMLSTNPAPLSELVKDRMQAYPVSGEINNTVGDPDAIIKQVEEIYAASALECDYTDGVSITFPDFRFNIRKSNTEPVLRLNVESRADQQLMAEKTTELLEIIQAG